MAVKANLGGITVQRFDKYDREPGTGVTRWQTHGADESAAIMSRRGRSSYAAPSAPSQSAIQRSAQGNKVAGATNISGGAL